MVGEIPSVVTVVLERGLRALIVVGAVFLLIRAWDVDRRRAHRRRFGVDPADARRWPAPS